LSIVVPFEHLKKTDIFLHPLTVICHNTEPVKPFTFSFVSLIQQLPNMQSNYDNEATLNQKRQPKGTKITKNGLISFLEQNSYFN